MQIFRKDAAGVIPSFPVWEIVVLCFLVTAAALSLLRPDFVKIVAVLGNLADRWSIIFIIAGLVCLGGLFVKAPMGLVIIIIGKVAVFTGSMGLYFSLASAFETWFFPGSSIVILLITGSLFRIIQILYLFRVTGGEVKHSRDTR